MSLTVQKADLTGVSFVIFRKLANKVDISGRVRASAEHLASLRVELFERDNVEGGRRMHIQKKTKKNMHTYTRISITHASEKNFFGSFFEAPSNDILFCLQWLPRRFCEQARWRPLISSFSPRCNAAASHCTFVCAATSHCPCSAIIWQRPRCRPPLKTTVVKVPTQQRAEVYVHAQACAHAMLSYIHTHVILSIV